jgi:hypothetical protein
VVEAWIGRIDVDINYYCMTEMGSVTRSTVDWSMIARETVFIPTRFDR